MGHSHLVVASQFCLLYHSLCVSDISAQVHVLTDQQGDFGKQVLVLAGSAFQPFPSDQKNGMGTIQSLSGTTLELKSSGQATRDLFAQQVLLLFLLGS